MSHPMQAHTTLKQQNTVRPARTPIWLCLALIAVSAFLYVSQVARVSSINSQLQQQSQISQQLLEQRQYLQLQTATEQSPAYILQQAANLGMQPGNWGDQP